MEALAEIIAISNEHRSTSQDGTQMSRFVVTFQIGMEPFHVTVFKKTENLERWPISTDGYVKGAIGTLTFDTKSEVRYSQKDNSPYVQYIVKHRWVAKSLPEQRQAAAVSAGTQPEAPADVVAAGMAEAAAVAEANIDPKTGLPF